MTVGDGTGEEKRHQAIQADRDNYVAGRDLTINIHYPTSSDQAPPEKALGPAQGRPLSQTAGAGGAALVAAVRPICIRYKFTSADSVPDAKIRRARLEHLPGNDEEMIAFYRWRRRFPFFNEDSGIAFTTWGIRIRRNHERVDIPYARVGDYEFGIHTVWIPVGISDTEDKYFRASKSGKVKIELELYIGRGPQQIDTCISDIQDLLRMVPTLLSNP